MALTTIDEPRQYEMDDGSQRQPCADFSASRQTRPLRPAATALRQPGSLRRAWIEAATVPKVPPRALGEIDIVVPTISPGS